ncbi:HsdM family class I SAM-dependent methyltransferase [Streptomyces mirabilis]|uniref:site-specific DNA-methyltransferase (adenine-specific) n=1 Tax=Streptomyces mirabilis TaxID=68239 RepID=A0A1I2DF24_9ACTN|nr:N-6 DNA methylase [Streptomyces mirabilis]SFE78773.1 type I restriction enzyme M protein [Streptomyces mirabilis]
MAANAYFATALFDGEAPVDWSPQGIFERFRKFFEDKLTHTGVTKLGYLDHLTYLLFLKIDHERAQRPGRLAQSVVPSPYSWPTIASKSGDVLRTQFAQILEELDKVPAGTDPQLSTVKAIFRDARQWNQQHLPEIDSLITDVLDEHNWSNHLPELGEAYGLLFAYCAKEVDVNREAGQVTTPSSLLRVVAAALAVTNSDRVVDLACGTAGSLLAAFDRMTASGDRLDPNAYILGADIDPRIVRFATMNILLNTNRPFTDVAPVRLGDSLAEGGVILPLLNGEQPPTVVICNPPYRSSTPIPAQRKDDLNTSLYPAAFLKHIADALPLGARAAVFVPDNVLSGVAAAAVLPTLFDNCEVHALLRLPENTFRNGRNKSLIKANVLFFTKREASPSNEPATTRMWLFDARTDRPKDLTDSVLDSFLSSYLSEESEYSPTSGFGPVSYEELSARQFQLQSFSVRLEADAALLRPAKVIASEIAVNLAAAQKVFEDLANELA